MDPAQATDGLTMVFFALQAVYYSRSIQSPLETLTDEGQVNVKFFEAGEGAHAAHRAVFFFSLGGVWWGVFSE